MSFASRFFGLATAKVQLFNKSARAFPIFFENHCNSGVLKISFNGRQRLYSAWMYSRLSHRIFLFFIQSRSPLRSFMENKDLRHDSRESIAS